MHVLSSNYIHTRVHEFVWEMNTVKYPAIEVIIYQFNALKPYKTKKYIFINISDNTDS
jgi:hypothetical protein